MGKQTRAHRPAIKPFAVIATTGAVLAGGLAAAPPAAAAPAAPMSSPCVAGSSATFDDVDLTTTRLRDKTRITRTTRRQVTARSAVTVRVAGEIRVTATAEACPDAMSNPVTLVKTVTVDEKRPATVTRTVRIRTTRGDARSRGQVTARNAATRAAGAAATKAAKADARAAAIAAAQALSSTSVGINDPYLPGGGVVTAPSDAEIETFRQQLRDELLLLHNEQRTIAGVQTMTQLSAVTAVAQAWAQQQAESHTFEQYWDSEGWSHSSPYPIAAMQACTDPGGRSGENIAWGASASMPLELSGAKAIAHTLVDAWMNSPGHRAAILNGKHNFAGFGVGLKFNASGSRVAVNVVADFAYGFCPELS